MGAPAPKTERREHKRYTTRIEVDIKSGNESSSGLLVGTSLEGLRISTAKSIQPSTDVVISFSNGKEVTILAGVVWVLDKNKMGLPIYLAGLQIYSIKVGNKDIQGLAARTAFFQDLND